MLQLALIVGVLFCSQNLCNRWTSVIWQDKNQRRRLRRVGFLGVVGFLVFCCWGPSLLWHLERIAVKKVSCVSLMSQEVSGAGTSCAACLMLDQPSIAPVGPCADSLLTASICISTSGFPKHKLVLHIQVDCQHASSSEAARGLFVSQNCSLYCFRQAQYKKSFFSCL